MIFGIGIAISSAFFFATMQSRKLIRTLKALRETRLELENLKEKASGLELKNKNITDSLVYAQRIQEALLPSQDYFRKFFRESFIFFHPKDIVSGDFYWIGEKGNKVFVAVADCTGHGVPGALMSMIGIEVLGKAINEDGLEDPAEILACMDKALEKTFSREKNLGTIIRDGMDIGLCVVDTGMKTLEFSGSFIPLYLIRENNLTEIKADKVIIGMNPSASPFTRNSLALETDDMLYLFSDGYIDQFGGNENKKFMYRRFRYLLMTIHRFPIEDQKSILEENLRSWMGRNQQIDDIMVIGFKPLSGTS
jgi:serine phosphatase RsbU (regulator of sigma subunit)